MNLWSADTTLKDIVVGFLAVWGAGLSTWQYAVAHRRRVRVTLRNAITADDDFILVTAINLGTRPCTIAMLTLELSDGRTLVPGQTELPDTKLPITITDGQFCEAYFHNDNVLSAMRRAGFRNRAKIRGIARDSLGRKYKSPKWAFELGK